MQVRLSPLLVAVGAVAALTGCGDDNAFRAQFPNQLRSHTVYAMNGTPPTLPSALSVRLNNVARIDPTFGFDVAFDMDPGGGGEVRIHSTRSVAGELSPVNRVGFQFAASEFDEVTKSPGSGFKYDTAFSLPVGRTLMVDVIDGSCSGFSFLGFNIRAKLIVDSVNTTTRAIYLRMLSNPNCGFISLVEGVPKE